MRRGKAARALRWSGGISMILTEDRIKRNKIQEGDRNIKRRTITITKQ